VNLFVADPAWGCWIVLYFFLGGLAAGAYFVAALIELIGNEADRGLARIGYRIAFPLIVICGILLTVDLERPGRFWHMLLQSQVVDQAQAEGFPWTGAGWLLMVQSLMLKPWSPMSIGAWALFLFGGFSFLSFLSSLWPNGWLDRFLHRRWLGHTLQLAGAGVGFFVASYTGALLTASNQPLWSQTEWVAPLFLASAASTGIAALLLLGRKTVPAAVEERLERADFCSLVLELGVFVVFLVSLGGSLLAVWQVWQGWVLLLGVPLLGLVLPLALHMGRRGVGGWRMPAAVISALLGGFLLRYAIVMTPPALLAHGTPTSPAERGTPAAWIRISPEDGRPRDGGAGASALNRVGVRLEHSKIPPAANP
jgi:formate-dependent nitrite reductase membrane component NrfD